MPHSEEGVERCTSAAMKVVARNMNQTGVEAEVHT